MTQRYYASNAGRNDGAGTRRRPARMYGVTRIELDASTFLVRAWWHLKLAAGSVSRQARWPWMIRRSREKVYKECASSTQNAK